MIYRRCVWQKSEGTACKVGKSWHMGVVERSLEMLREKRSQGSVCRALQATVRSLGFILSAAGSHWRVLRKKVACILEGNVPWTFGNINLAEPTVYVSVTWISHCPRNIKLLRYLVFLK